MKDIDKRFIISDEYQCLGLFIDKKEPIEKYIPEGYSVSLIDTNMVSMNKGYYLFNRPDLEPYVYLHSNSTVIRKPSELELTKLNYKPNKKDANELINHVTSLKFIHILHSILDNEDIIINITHYGKTVLDYKIGTKVLKLFVDIIKDNVSFPIEYKVDMNDFVRVHFIERYTYIEFNPFK